MKILFLHRAKWLPIIGLAAGFFPSSFTGAEIPKKPQATANPPAPTPTPKPQILPPLVAAPANLPPLVQTKPGKFRIVALPVGFTVCGINNKGEVGGTWLLDPVLHVPTEKSRAALWRKGTVHVFTTFDAEPAHGAAINDASQVAGSHGSITTGAFTVWTGDVVVWQTAANRSTSQLIGHFPEMSLAEATSINGRGHVVGSSQPSSMMERPPELRVENASIFRFAFFSNGNKMILLGNGTAYGINDREQVTGSRDEKIMLWQENQALVLGPGEGRAINNRSQIVGSSTSKSARPHAMLCERGLIKDLGTLPGTNQSEALAINDRGQIVGSSSYFYDAKKQRAFLWQSGAMVDLNALIPPRSGWILYDALSINNKGQVVGTGTLKGKERSFLLTPR